MLRLPPKSTRMTHSFPTRRSSDLGVKNGTLGTVAMASSQRMAVRTDDGREVAFETKDHAHVDHGYAATIHKAQGMTVDRTHVLARSEEHTSELQSLMRISYAVFCLKQKKKKETKIQAELYN